MDPDPIQFDDSPLGQLADQTLALVPELDPRSVRILQNPCPHTNGPGDQPVAYSTLMHRNWRGWGCNGLCHLNPMVEQLLCLTALPRDAQSPGLGLIRVSIWFPAPDLRKRFGGGPYRCPKETQGDFELCRMQGHQGLFGFVKDFYRRLLIQYYEQADNLVDVVHGLPYGWLPCYAIDIPSL